MKRCIFFYAASKIPLTAISKGLLSMTKQIVHHNLSVFLCERSWIVYPFTMCGLKKETMKANSRITSKLTKMKTLHIFLDSDAGAPKLRARQRRLWEVYISPWPNELKIVRMLIVKIIAIYSAVS